MNISTLYTSFKNDTARAYQFFQICRFISAMLAGMILVNLSYSEQSVSQYEWFLFCIYALSFFWSMGLKNALLSFYPDLAIDRQKRLISTLFFTFLICAVPLSFIGSRFLFEGGEFTLLFLVYFSLSIPATLVEQYFILNKKSAELFHFGFWIHVLYVIAIVIAAILYGTVYAVIIGIVLWSAVRFLYAILKMKSTLTLEFDWGLLKQFLGFGLPLMLYIMLGSGMDVVDGFIVEHFYGEDQFAKFRYGAKELPITALVIGALVSAMIPQLVTSFEGSLQILKARIDGLMNWMFPLTIILLLISPYLYSFFYNDNYALSALIFNTYLLILISRLLTPQALLYALKENKVLMWTSLVELTVNLILSLMLMKYFGILGIVYATVIAYTLEKVILTSYLKLRRGINIGEYINMSKYAFGSLLLLVTYVVVSI